MADETKVTEKITHTAILREGRTYGVPSWGTAGITFHNGVGEGVTDAQAAYLRENAVDKVQVKGRGFEIYEKFEIIKGAPAPKAKPKPLKRRPARTPRPDRDDDLD